ncbi:hypothetical protein ACFX2B_027323 [Malus domestica]
MGVQENALGDKFTYPFVLKAWARESAIDKGREVFDGFTMKDVVFWNTMKMGYARNGMVFEASDGFREMVEMGEEIWVRIVWDMFIGTSLVDLYAKCGSIEATREVFDQKDKKTVATWNAILSG